MHMGADNPVITMEALDQIVAASAVAAGALMLWTGQGISRLITDGDLRRALQQIKHAETELSGAPRY